MQDTTAKTIFKVVGGIHVFFSLLMTCSLVALIIALASLYAGNAQLEAVGAQGTEPIPAGVLLIGVPIALVSSILYALSAFGFLKLKKFQPALFTAVVVLSVIDMTYNLFVNGIQLMSLVSLVFFFVWTALLFLVWQKKTLFTN